MNAAHIAERLGGRRSGTGWVARCPAHDDREPSLSIRDGRGRVLLKCFAGCSFAAISTALSALGAGVDSGTGRQDRILFDDSNRHAQAHRIWREAKSAIGTLVEKYLQSRGITIPVPPSLRFALLRHPTGIYAPAMVAAVQRSDGQMVAIHRTFLKSDDSGKASLHPPKMALGPIATGAVHFAKGADRIALAEGIETALSIQQATGIATWATLGSANLVHVAIPDIVRDVIVCADADVAGENAAQAAAVRLLRQGRHVRIARPPRGLDFNDLLLLDD